MERFRRVSIGGGAGLEVVSQAEEVVEIGNDQKSFPSVQVRGLIR